MKGYDAVLFDMDGVIFDSEQLYMRCWEELQDEFDVPGIRDVLIRCIGVNSRRTREIFMEAYGPDFPYDEAMAASFRKWKELLVDGKLPLKPGAERLLSALHEAGVPIAIASSTRTDVVKKELQDVGLLRYFDAIIGGDQVTASKPEPDIFLRAMEVLGRQLKPENCFVIEDSFNGIRAAHAAGMRPIMVPDLLQPTDEIRGMAEQVLPDLYAVKTYLLDIDLDFKREETPVVVQQVVESPNEHKLRHMIWGAFLYHLFFGGYGE